MNLTPTPQRIKDFLDANPKMKRYARTRKHTTQYTEFCKLCEEEGIDLTPYSGYSIKTVKLSLRYNLPLPTCSCGAITSFRFNTDGEIYPASCSMVCRNQNIDYHAKIASVKLSRYSNPEWKATVEGKRRSTVREKYGVDYPMQHVDLFLKQQAACFKKDENGLHGYEPYAHPHFKELYPDLCLGTEYLKETNVGIYWLDDEGTTHKSFPDFFSKTANTFIEIKSPYTFSVGEYKIRKCIGRLHEMGIGYVLCIVTLETAEVKMTIQRYNTGFITDDIVSDTYSVNLPFLANS